MHHILRERSESDNLTALGMNEVKKNFRPEKYILCNADVSQIHLRIEGQLSWVL
jgi:hypothetical protein